MSKGKVGIKFDYDWYINQKPKYKLSFNYFYVRISRGDSIESIMNYRPPAYEAKKLWRKYKKSCDNPCTKTWFLACYRKGMRGKELFSIRHTDRLSDGPIKMSKIQQKINKKRKEQGWYQNNNGEWIIPKNSRSTKDSADSPPR